MADRIEVELPSGRSYPVVVPADVPFEMFVTHLLGRPSGRVRETKGGHPPRWVQIESSGDSVERYVSFGSIVALTVIRDSASETEADDDPITERKRQLLQRADKRSEDEFVDLS